MNKPVAYHFRVDFVLMPNPLDIRFQEVSGMSTELMTNDIEEAGHTIQLASGVKHDNLILKRGVAIGSLVSNSFNIAMHTLKYIPQTVMVTLLSDRSLPLASWWFLGACPHKWSVNDFNAEANSLVIETLEFTYRKLQVVKI